jgi:hypothetical protein
LTTCNPPNWGHGLVEHRHVDRAGLDQIQRLPAGPSGERLHALRLEQAADGLMPSLLLIRKEDSQPVGSLGLDHGLTAQSRHTHDNNARAALLDNLSACKIDG